MSDYRISVFSPRPIIGTAIIIIGLLVLLSNLGWDINADFWDFWPLILILIGLSMLVKKSEHRNTLWGSIFTLIGLIILLNNLDIIDFGANLIWPLIIIVIGISIVRHGSGRVTKAENTSDRVDVTAILGGGEYNFTSRSLSGGSAFALMGGAKLDFRKADFAGNTMVIDVMTIMGGLEIIVPENWQVVLQGTPILGGMDDKTSYRPAAGEDAKAAKQLIIKGTAIMGGVDIKN